MQSDFSDIPIYTRKIEGKDYTFDLGKLFRIRSYFDINARKGFTPMKYLGKEKDKYGLGWKTKNHNTSIKNKIKFKVDI